MKIIKRIYTVTQRSYSGAPYYGLHRTNAFWYNLFHGDSEPDKYYKNFLGQIKRKTR